MIAGVIGFLSGLALAGIPKKTRMQHYQIKNDKLKKNVRVCILSDLHDDLDKVRQEHLLSMIYEIHPDFILMPGDMCEVDKRHNNTLHFLHELKDKYPMFYVTGNHEQRRWDVTELKQLLQNEGVEVLEDRQTTINVNGQLIEIVGMDARLHEYQLQANQINSLFQTDGYRILISHCPHLINVYDQVECDLIVCGHAHGGQWHIPFIDQPVAAPQQGVFPKYTGGVYDLKQSKMVVSRGLVKDYHGIPRFYNDPEFVIVDLIATKAM